MKLPLDSAFAKKFFWILFSITTLVMIWSSFDFPTNGDELEHIANGKANVKFLTSLGKDTSYLNPPAPFRKEKDMKLMRYYGVFTDITADGFCGVVTRLGISYMDGRHIWNVLLAMLGVLFTALTARLFTKSWWAASIALAIMIATPPFTGFAYNLTKDIPLATGFIMALFAVYYIFLHITEPVSKKMLLILVLGIGISIGNRVSGVLIYAYAGLFLCIAAYRNRKIMPMQEIRTKALWVIGSLVVGHFLGLLFWPYGLVSPIGHFKETMDVVSNYPLKMSTMFEGENMDINNPLWYFIPKYILITTPLVFILGLVLSLFVTVYNKTIPGKQYWLIFFLLILPGIFPIAYIIYKKSVVLQCWRHFLFVFPTLVVLAAMGWYYLLSNGKKIVAGVAGVVFLLLFLKPVVWMVQNHPYEYTYFNELVGGVRGANNNYELDSYCFGVKNCFKWIAEHNDLKKDTLVINCNEDDPPIYYSREYIKQPVKNIIGGFRTRSGREWDYGVYNTLFLSKEEREKFFPPQNYELVHAEYVDGDVPVYIVLKRKGKLDLMGFEAFEKHNYQLADSLLSQYNKESGYYANACVGMEFIAKLNLQRFKEAKELYEAVQRKGLNMPEEDYYGAVAYAYSGDLPRARMILAGAIERGLNNPEAMQLMQQFNQQMSRGNGGGPVR